MQNAIKAAFTEIEVALQQLSNEQYCRPCSHLFNASIGQHVRHILDLFVSLLNGYNSGLVNYDNRKRDVLVETDKARAISVMHGILSGINRPGKELLLEGDFGGTGNIIVIETNFIRELAYNLEHTTHHMAMIKVGINELGGIKLAENFGVAPATIKHKIACAQ
jgi:hypothetical protein